MLAFALAFGVSSFSAAQTAAPSAPTPVSWVQQAAAHEVHIIDDDGEFPVRYRVRRIDAKNDITREIIESRDGAVARLIQRNGAPLTAEEDAAERGRLQDILDDPSAFLKAKKRNTTARNYAINLVKLMPQAMIFTYTPGQPQPPNAPGQQIVLDFKPDPNFHPPTTISELLTGLEGRMWIDRRTGVLTRTEARVIKGVNFGWGVLAHIYPGGTVEFEQAEVGNGRWVYSRLDEHVSVRELMIHTANENNRLSASDLRLLPNPLGYREAIQQLLAMSLPR
ncbi:hypothetical protein ACFQBQ_03920 [Granulicella cerasi]|uniref:MucB/RseB N-terminal domain-containing protein n=1 Tax=Granulicella cerasi TaxID=741063 RepID=A0ABW1Z8D9_9BACT|nr:hypothetical protein [Granulicella cerasi]